MNACDQEKRLTPFLLGDLPGPEAEAVRLHLAQCDACRETVRVIEPALAALRTALARDARSCPELSPSRRSALLAVRPGSSRRVIRWFRVYRPLLVAAACIALILGVLTSPLRYCGMVSPYRVPKGSGSPELSFSYDTETERSERDVWETLGRSLASEGGQRAEESARPAVNGSAVGFISGVIMPDGGAADSDGTVDSNGDAKPRSTPPPTPPRPVVNAYFADGLEGGRGSAETVDGKRGGVSTIAGEMQALMPALDYRLPDKSDQGISPVARLMSDHDVSYKGEARFDKFAPGGEGLSEREVLKGTPQRSADMGDYASNEGSARRRGEAVAPAKIANDLLSAEPFSGRALGKDTPGVPGPGRKDLVVLKPEPPDYARSVQDRVSPTMDTTGSPATQDAELKKKLLSEASSIAYGWAKSQSAKVSETPPPPAEAQTGPDRPVMKVQKKRKEIVAAPQYAISFHFPDLDDSRIAAEVDKESRTRYDEDGDSSESRASRFYAGENKPLPPPIGALFKGKEAGGKMGMGGGGTGGWPDGMQNAKIRFIRLKYDGPGWDDGMDENSRADRNFLEYFRSLTGFKTADLPESHGIALLSKYPKGYAPPFVYMTGTGDIPASDKDVGILREYLMNGGMLFADCGSPQWNSNFRAFMQRVFPGEELRKIADDDQIFQTPFAFVNGAPPVQPQGGKDALGIRHKGRLAVFYHPGNLKAAWKNNHGGLSPKAAEGALELGVNVLYYSFLNYQELTRKYRDESKAPEPPADPAPPAKPRVPAAFNPFVETAAERFSTFAIDVDTASYTLTRQAIRAGALPEPEVVRTEEIVNAFDYGDTAPEHATFRVYVEGAPSPFGPELTLLRIGVKGRRLGREEQRPAMLTFLIDTSGSMSQPDRIGMARTALKLLLANLAPTDRIQIVAYDDRARGVLEPTAARDAAAVMAAFDSLQCTGSTNLEDGMRKAYARAARAFIPGAENRVILVSDGVANLGAGDAREILGHIEAFRRQGITCSVFGVGKGTYNDEMLEQIANKGDGVYRFLDSVEEAQRVFVTDLAATLNTIATDVKIQVEWNPAAVRRYRQFGYENRALTKEQFRDDTVDAGEIGSGQSVTALYELETGAVAGGRSSPALGTVRVRYRRADTRAIEEIETPIPPEAIVRMIEDSRPQFKLAAAAAEFAEILRVSPYASGSRFENVASLLRPVALDLPLDTRVKELLTLAEQAEALSK